MDINFIKNIEKCTSFNLTAKNFETIKNKDEIRHLLSKHWFSRKEPTFQKKLTSSTISKGINKAITLTNFSHLFNYQPKGLGPGEIMLYYLFDDVCLGGGQSAGVDVKSSAGNFEVKGVVTIAKNELYGEGPWLTNFKLGGKAELSGIMQELKRLSGKKGNEINQRDLKKIKKEQPEEFDKITKEYQAVAAKYFKDEQVIFLSSKKHGKYKLGELVYFGSLKPENVFISHMTTGTVKPMIKI